MDELTRQIQEVQHEIDKLKDKENDTSRRAWAALRQEKAALREKEVLLMKQQGAAGGGSVGKLDEKLEEVDRKLVKLTSLQLQAMSSTRHASSISSNDLSLVEGSLNIVWTYKGLEALSDQASAVIEDPTEYTWEANKHEAKHKNDYMQVLKDKVNLPGHLSWSTRVDEPKILKTPVGIGGANLPFSIGCKTDALVVVRKAAVDIEGAVAATMEFKKRAVRQSVVQTKTTWICASLNSHLPVLSALTDMTDVFAAFYTEGETDGSRRTICIQHMFLGADDLFAFMANALSSTSIPANVLRYCRDDHGEEKFISALQLPNPKRVRLPVPKQHSISLWHDAMRVLAQHAAGHEDIACLDDLMAFDDQNEPGTHGQVDAMAR